MPALVAGSHAFRVTGKSWMAGTSPAMTMWMVTWPSILSRHDQVLPFVHARRLPRIDHRRTVELVEDCGARDREPDVEPFALVDRAVNRLAVKPCAARFSQGVGQPRAGAHKLWQLDRRHPADAAQAVGDDLDWLLGRAVAEHLLVLRV